MNFRLAGHHCLAAGTGLRQPRKSEAEAVTGEIEVGTEQHTVARTMTCGKRLTRAGPRMTGSTMTDAVTIRPRMTVTGQVHATARSVGSERSDDTRLRTTGGGGRIGDGRILWTRNGKRRRAGGGNGGWIPRRRREPLKIRRRALTRGRVQTTGEEGRREEPEEMNGGA